MNKQGHKGISVLFAAPIVALLLVLELFVFAALFVGVVFLLASVPDVDIHLKKYESYSIRAVSLRHYPWVIVSKMSWMLMNMASRFIDRVPERESGSFTVQHRGITHTAWFGIALGVVLGGLTLGVVSSMYVVSGVEVGVVGEVLNTHPGWLPVVMFVGGFFAVALHCVGDVFTPTGIHFLTPRVDYGYSFNQFRFDNKVANSSAVAFGFVALGAAVVVGLAWGEVSTLYLLGGFLGIYVIGIPLWLVFVRTVLGRATYKLYNFIR